MPKAFDKVWHKDPILKLEQNGNQVSFKGAETTCVDKVTVMKK